jgi:hypothetical protein
MLKLLLRRDVYQASNESDKFTQFMVALALF